MNTKTINLSPVHGEVVSARRYLDLYKSNPEEIESVEIIPAVLGSGTFGSIYVKYKHPTYLHLPLVKMKKLSPSKKGWVLHLQKSLNEWRKR